LLLTIYRHEFERFDEIVTVGDWLGPTGLPAVG